MPCTEQLPSRLKDREGATLVLLSTICLQEGSGGVCQRKRGPPRHLKEPRSGPLNHCRSFHLCDWSASFSRSSQHTGRACPNVLLPESGTQYKANTETLTAATAMGFPPQTLIITNLDHFWPKQWQQRLEFLLSWCFGYFTAVVGCIKVLYIDSLNGNELHEIRFTFLEISFSLIGQIRFSIAFSRPNAT